MVSDAKYIGNELDIFSNATNWKKYFSDKIDPFISGDVLEVGAGIGINTKYFINKKTRSITSIEPDKELFEKMLFNHKDLPFSNQCKFNCTIKEVEASFDTIIYIDVLEHILESNKEIELIEKRLKPGGHLIILVPAYNFLYSEFDKSIGHFRRYNKKILRKEVDNRLFEKDLFYLDSLGVIASLMNKTILKKNSPSLKNIIFWDKILVPISKILDVITNKTFGKSLIGIYAKDNLVKSKTQ